MAQKRQWPARDSPGHRLGDHGGDQRSLNNDTINIEGVVV